MNFHVIEIERDREVGIVRERDRGDRDISPMLGLLCISLFTSLPKP